MSRRLGEILVRSGRLTEEELRRALDAQHVFGGHLGTSLLELGYVDEETLGETLSSVYNVPFASSDMLSSVPYTVVRSLPPKLAQKHKVIPLRLVGRTLHIAMVDPKNLLSLDEVAFVTGFRIDPWVAPELRVLQALEKYYSLPCGQRFVTLSRALSKVKTRPESRTRAASDGVAGKSDAQTDRKAPRAALTVTASAPGATVVRATGMSPPAPTETHNPDQNADIWEKYGYGRSWREVAEAIDPAPEPREEQSTDEVDRRSQPTARPVSPREPFPEQPTDENARPVGAPEPRAEQPADENARPVSAPEPRAEQPADESARQMGPPDPGREQTTDEVDTRPQPTARSITPPQPRAERQEYSLMDASKRLAVAGSVEDVVEASMAYLSRRLSRTIFFVVKAERAIGWAGGGDGLSQVAVRALALPMGDQDSMLSLVQDGESHYFGPLPQFGTATTLHERMGLTPPLGALLVPITVTGKVAAYLYGDGGEEELRALDVREAVSLGERAAAALQILILRNKILSL